MFHWHHCPSLFWFGFILHLKLDIVLKVAIGWFGLFGFFSFKNLVLFLFVFSEELHGNEKHNLGKRNQLTEDEPDVNHLDVGGGGEALHLADEDGRHHQHGGKVHTQSRLKEEGLEEGGGKGDGQEKEGREVGGHDLADKLSLHHNQHSQAFIVIVIVNIEVQFPKVDLEHMHVQILFH